MEGRNPYLLNYSKNKETLSKIELELMLQDRRQVSCEVKELKGEKFARRKLLVIVRKRRCNVPGPLILWNNQAAWQESELQM